MYGDVFGSEGIEENAGGNLHVIAQRNFADAVGDGTYLEARPRGINAGAPGSEIAGACGIIGLEQRIAAMGGEIVFASVLHDHAVHVEFRTQMNDGRFHAIDPFAGQAIGAAFIEGRNDFALE